jgi:8-oxo-dGTP pyrophosphatase MutT (NUDIX family)
MSQHAEKIHLGAYAWLVTPKGDGTIFFEVHPEDGGKQERIPGTSEFAEWKDLVPGMLCLIGGGVEEGEHHDLRQTIVRESKEERAVEFTPDRVSNGLPVVRVEQQKIGKPGVVVFDAVGHRVTLTEAELVFLQNEFPNITVADVALADFLNTEGRKILRPYVYIAAQQILAKGLLNSGGAS